MTNRLLRSRSARVVPAAISSIILIVLAVLVGWAAISALIHSGASASLDSSLPGLDLIGDQTWGSPGVIAAGAVLAALGALVFFIAIVPGRRRIASIQQLAPAHVRALEVALPSSSLASLAAAAADSVDGVSSVKVSSSSTSTLVTFTTPLRDTSEVQADVEAAVSQRFSDISFERTPKVKVHALRRSL